MIGGKVIAIRPEGDRVMLWCMERPRSPGFASECGVYVENKPGLIPAQGDDVWWQSGKVYWTPADLAVIDRPLVKIGYSSSSEEMRTGLRTHPTDAADGGEVRHG